MNSQLSNAISAQILVPILPIEPQDHHQPIHRVPVNSSRTILKQILQLNAGCSNFEHVGILLFTLPTYFDPQTLSGRVVSVKSGMGSIKSWVFFRSGMVPLRSGLGPFGSGMDTIVIWDGLSQAWNSSLKPKLGPLRNEKGPFRPGMSPSCLRSWSLRHEEVSFRLGTGPLKTEFFI